MKLRNFLVGLALFSPVITSATTQDPLYALFEYATEGPAGAFRAVEIIAVDGDQRTCNSLLEAMKEGYAESLGDGNDEATSTLGQQGCRSDLPKQYRALPRGERLKDTFYLSRTLELPGQSHQLFTVLYGEGNGQGAVDAGKLCSQLLRAFAASRKFSNLSCVGPRTAFKTKTTTTYQVWPPQKEGEE